MKNHLNPLQLIFLLFCSAGTTAQNYSLSSPDRGIVVNVTVGPQIQWSVIYKDETILQPSELALEFADGKVLGNGANVKKKIATAVNNVISVPVPVKSRFIAEKYNQLELQFKGDFSVVFRAYDDGVAYHFITRLGTREVMVKNEKATFNFGGNYQTAWPSNEPVQFCSHARSARRLARFWQPESSF